MARDVAPLVVADNLQKYFPTGEKGLSVKAVDGVSFEVRKGETLGVVGESGCGKSTVGRLVLRLLAPTGGRVSFDGADLATMDRRQLRLLRRRMQIIFQDPYASLDPRKTVLQILSEPFQIHYPTMDRAEMHRRIAGLADRVGLRPEQVSRYPHEFSGGQRQRIALARALIVEPDLLVLDEPTSALDVTIQKQVLSLLQRLQKERGLAYLLITHDVDVVRAMAHDVMVLKDGEVVESGPAAEVLGAPNHPYTRRLLEAA